MPLAPISSLGAYYGRPWAKDKIYRCVPSHRGCKTRVGRGSKEGKAADVKVRLCGVEAFRALKDETPRYEMVKELAEAKEES